MPSAACLMASNWRRSRIPYVKTIIYCKLRKEKFDLSHPPLSLSPFWKYKYRQRKLWSGNVVICECNFNGLRILYGKFGPAHWWLYCTTDDQMLLEFGMFYASGSAMPGIHSNQLLTQIFPHLQTEPAKLIWFDFIFVYVKFLEEIDYSLAFKTLSDRATFKSISDKTTIVFSDAMDTYYNCIWDATLLEFIVNFLAKRGEHARKQLAVIVQMNFSILQIKYKYRWNYFNGVVLLCKKKN